MHKSKYSTRVKRFWERVNFYGPIVRPELGHCWIFLGSAPKSGYPRFQWFGQSEGVHRISHEMHIGPVPEGLDVMHACDMKRCVNPTHLKAGTRKQNMQDASKRGLTHRGSRTPNARLTETIVLDARRRYIAGESNASQLAAEAGVSVSGMWMAIVGIHWKHVGGLESDISKLYPSRFTRRI